MTTEIVEATKQEVTLHNIPSGVMELLMEYMYTGETNIPSGLLLPATEACDYLQLLELRERCLRQALIAIKPNNTISWHKLANNLNIDELKTRCLDLLSSSLVDVSKGSEFLELSFPEVSSCISGAQEIGADSDDLLEATINWVDHKHKSRHDHILDMLEKTDLTRCSVECLNMVTDKHKDLLYAQPAAQGILMKSLTQIASQESRKIRKKRNEHGSKDAMIIVIAGHDGAPNFTPQADCWHLDKSMNFVDLCKLTIHFRWHSVCQIPGGFVVSGGVCNKLCAMFILSTKSWKQLESLPAQRDGHGSLFMKGKIYLFGNYSGKSRSSAISLDLEGGKWKQEPDIPTKVQNPEVTSVDSSIYLFNCHGSQLLQLDTMTKSWSTNAKPPQQNYKGARMISVCGQLLICGGYSRVFAQYNPSSDTWTIGNAPTLLHGFGGLVHLDQKVYLIGGEHEDRVEEYDLGTKAWSICDVKLPKKLENLQAVAI